MHLTRDRSRAKADTCPDNVPVDAVIAEECSGSVPMGVGSVRDRTEPGAAGRLNALMPAGEILCVPRRLLLFRGPLQAAKLTRGVRMDSQFRKAAIAAN